MSEHRPRPRAFRLDDERVAVDDAPAPAAPTATIRSQGAAIPEPSAPEPIDEAERAVEAAQSTGMLARWRPKLATLVWAGLTGLVSLGLGLWLSALIENLFARARALGAIGAAFAALFLVGIVGLAIREIAALWRQSRIAELHAALARARAGDDRVAARALVGKLAALYEGRAETARARAEVAEARGAIVDGRDLIDIAERALLRPLDVKAQAEIAAAARRVSMVTAISPRAVLDMIFVVAQIVRLVRRIAELYGGRPGFFGFVKLARSIFAHIAITGGMAVGDGLVQQLVGHSIASRISARMGEGVLNGLLTARVGLSALAVCRPAPFAIDKPPGVADVAPFLFGAGKDR
ncbi:MAG: TIGR01620 family protein [Roseiarcus sp.]|jgi:putative membrane protein